MYYRKVNLGDAILYVPAGLLHVVYLLEDGTQVEEIYYPVPSPFSNN